jgi:hypothetical protein
MTGSSSPSISSDSDEAENVLKTPPGVKLVCKDAETNPELLQAWAPIREEVLLLAERKLVLEKLVAWITRLQQNVDGNFGQCAACPKHCLSSMCKQFKGVPGRKPKKK